MISVETRRLLAFRFLKGIGRSFLNDIAIQAESMDMPIDKVFLKRLEARRYSDEQLNEAFEKAEYHVTKANSLKHHIISRLDSVYPDSLRSVRDAPPILFCSGNLELLTEDSVAIIGTRTPTEHGELIASRVTKWFASNNWCIASGLAKGIDTIAHQACLDVRGRTIAVLAHGLEKVYPAQNKELASDIEINSGLLITEYHYESYVGKSNFVERDRIQAALVKAVILVQSDNQGGSLHASRAILNYDRYLLVVGQSKKDEKLKEKKIEANITLLYGDISKKADLLKVNIDRLDKLLLLPDKESLDSVSSLVRKIEFRPIKREREEKQLF